MLTASRHTDSEHCRIIDCKRMDTFVILRCAHNQRLVFDVVHIGRMLDNKIGLLFSKENNAHGSSMVNKLLCIEFVYNLQWHYLRVVNWGRTIRLIMKNE